MIKKKEFGIILAFNDYKKFYSQNKELICTLSSRFKKIYVINVINLRLRVKEEKIINSNILPKNFECLSFNRSKDFLNFFSDKNFVAIQYLAKNPDFFKIFFLIKLAKIKNIMIKNLGNFGNKLTPDFNKNNIFAFQHYYNKGFYYIFRIFTILNLFPKIDLLFESDKEIIEAHKNGISRKFENKFPFFKISYFRKIELINSIFFDQFKNKDISKINTNEKYILYIDVPIDHEDRLQREGKVEKSIKSNFYINLKNFLRNFSYIFDLKVVVGLHPASKDGYDHLSEFEIRKERTVDLIPGSEIILVTHSSLIASAILYNKKILSLNSKYLGKFLSEKTIKYKKSLELYSANIDEKFSLKKDECQKEMLKSIKNYENYINTRLKADGENLPNEKIVKTIKEMFF
tara:strand:+ start:4327 stop:5535 length:1209 start_codon:yes stop_codon:yes gene_type:complete